MARKKKSRQPAPTTILALSDDLLREVFLRLPSLPSLVRAALACPAFLRAVRSSPTFRRRFSEIHSPTILGSFLADVEPPMPTFVPIRLRGRRSDPDHAAALGGLDVFLTRLPDAIGDKKDDDEDDGGGDEGPEWTMTGCHAGYVVLVTPRRNTKKVAVYDPLTRALHLFPAPPDEVFSGEAEFHVIPSGADERSFRLLCVSDWRQGRGAVAVLSPDNMKWQITPTAGILKDAGDGTLVNGSVCWPFARKDNFPVLNTATLRFSQIDLPGRVSRYGCLTGGETSDGKPCLVKASNFGLDVWVWRAADDGIGEWTHETFDLEDDMYELDLDTMDDFSVLIVQAISRGTVYLSFHAGQPPSRRSCLLSFCLETGELRKLCRIAGDGSCYPYIMTWPPSFVHNKARSGRFFFAT